MSSRKAISDACSTVLARAPGKTLDFMPANFLAMPGPCSGKRLHGHSIAPDVHDDREGWRFDLGMGWPRFRVPMVLSLTIGTGVTPPGNGQAAPAPTALFRYVTITPAQKTNCNLRVTHFRKSQYLKIPRLHEHYTCVV
jgi:hypothetical protein